MTRDLMQIEKGLMSSMNLYQQRQITSMSLENFLCIVKQIKAD